MDFDLISQWFHAGQRSTLDAKLLLDRRITRNSGFNILYQVPHSKNSGKLNAQFIHSLLRPDDQCVT